VSDSKGWGKLKHFCATAREHSLSFTWADTCCIDKTSSTELDESIRSMFRWYKNSSICIVHLVNTSVEADLAEDEWFTRGWTLLELLAPPCIRFYNRYWAPLSTSANDKTSSSSLLQTVSDITSISLEDLIHFHPSSAKRIDRRMTWAANRRVTRDEDASYSLMVIFDVSIPIVYGEGHSRAFCRLVQAIMMAGGHVSVFNWPGVCAHRPVSSAFPASPRSYQNHPEFLDMYRQPIHTAPEVAFTNRGLRLSVVLVPARITFTDSESDCSSTTLVPNLQNLTFGLSKTIEWRPDKGHRRAIADVKVIYEDDSFIDATYRRVDGRPAYNYALCITHYYAERPTFVAEPQLRVCNPLTGFFVAFSEGRSTQVKRLPMRIVDAAGVMVQEGALSEPLSSELLRTIDV